MDFVQEHLRTKKRVNFGDSQDRSNNIDLEVLADTIYIRVRCSVAVVQNKWLAFIIPFSYLASQVFILTFHIRIHISLLHDRDIFYTYNWTTYVFVNCHIGLGILNLDLALSKYAFPLQT